MFGALNADLGDVDARGEAGDVLEHVVEAVAAHVADRGGVIEVDLGIGVDMNVVQGVGHPVRNAGLRLRRVPLALAKQGDNDGQIPRLFEFAHLADAVVGTDQFVERVLELPPRGDHDLPRSAGDQGLCEFAPEVHPLVDTVVGAQNQKTLFGVGGIKQRFALVDFDLFPVDEHGRLPFGKIHQGKINPFPLDAVIVIGEHLQATAVEPELALDDPLR